VTNDSPTSVISLDGEKQALLHEIKELKKQKVSKLRTVNQGWNIGLTVSSLTLTAITTVLGVINVEGYKGLMTFLVSFTGAAAIATQSASKELRIRGKAGDYSQVEAELVILEYKVPRAKTLEEIENLEEKLHEQVRKVAEIESKEE
jgi:phage FluMu protein Com